MNLEGKTALITGGSRGLGKAIALRLGDAGADIVINYQTREDAAREVAEEIQRRGRRAVALGADVSRTQEVKDLFARALEAMERVDILVNNAGILRDNLLLRMSDDQWDEVMSVNLRSAFLCTREAIRPMLRQRWGRIINISSAIAVKGNIGQSNYAASKAGMLGFTCAVAREVATRNITANAVMPGYIETEIVEDIAPKAKETILAHIPVGHFGTPEDVAGIVAYLASEEARYITGQAIAVDGGITL